MKIIALDFLSASQKQDLFRLWNQEYFQRITYATMEELEAYLFKLSEKRYWVLMDKNQVMGCCVKYTRNNAKWFFILLDSNLHGQGYGSTLMNRAKEGETELNGWVIPHSDYFKNNGMPYISPLGFYKKNGFRVIKNEILDHEKFKAVKIQWIKK